MVVLPGVASAHHVTLEGTITCDDGSFNINADYSGGGEAKIIRVWVNNDEYDIDEGDVVTNLGNNDANLAANQPAVDEDYTENGQGLNTTLSGSIDLDTDGDTDDSEFNFSTDRDRFEIDGHGGSADATDGLDNFFAVGGDFEDVENNGGVTVETRMYGAEDDDDLDDTNIPDGSNPLQDTDSKSVNVADYSECIIAVCTDGEHISDYEFEQGASTGDCDPIRVCVDGQNFLVTEFEQQESGLATGDCIPFEPPPPPSTPPTITTPPAPVQQVAAAVSEVLPARLPSTGMGPGENSSSFSWAAAAAATLLALGGMTALVARRKES
jgi:hypothetical protein